MEIDKDKIGNVNQMENMTIYVVFVHAQSINGKMYKKHFIIIFK